MTRNWNELRDERMSEPGAKEAYDATRLAYEFGRRVRERRGARGLSQAELAAAVGTSQPAIARLEGGGTEPTLRTITALARVLGSVWIISASGVDAGVSGKPVRASRRTPRSA